MICCGKNKYAQIQPSHSPKLHKHLQKFPSSINMSPEQPAHTDLGHSHVKIFHKDLGTDIFGRKK